MRLIPIILILFLVGCTTDCEKAKKDIDAFIEEHSECEEDSDCSLLMSYAAGINADSYDKAVSHLKDYEENCESAVEPKSGSAKCIEKKCTFVKKDDSGPDGENHDSDDQEGSEPADQEIPKVPELPDDESTDIPDEPEDDEQTCPPCSDGDSCTKDTCSDETDYKCKYVPIRPCCGNGIWEKGEDPDTCPDDMIQCDDVEEECMTSKFNYNTGSCEIMPKIPCCGNGFCDIGETDSDCADECAPIGRVDLASYPDFLGSPLIFVLGDEATGHEVFSAVNIGNFLYTEEGIETETMVNKQLDDPDNYEMIVIGDPCVNELWDEFFGIRECDDFLMGHDGVIKVIENKRYKLIFMTGSTPENTRALSKVLYEPDNYDLEGSEVFATILDGKVTLVDK